MEESQNPISGASSENNARIEREPRIKIFKMEEFSGKPKSEVVKFIRERYGTQYDFPGIPYQDYLLRNPDKVPRELKDGFSYYLVGSIRTEEGEEEDEDSNFHCLQWLGGCLRWDGERLGSEWGMLDRIILLEK